jgi:two-component system chemotaxis sensor kinase CheA
VSRYAELFATESRDHLTAMEHALLELEASPADREALDALFRSVHTLKGMGGAMGYEGVSTLSHAMESLLDRVRSGRESLGPASIETLLQATDALASAVSSATSGTASALDLSGLLTRLTVTAPDAPVPAGLREVAIALEPGTPLPGARAQLVVARLGRCARVDHVSPDAATMEQPSFDGRFVVRLTSSEALEVLADAARSAGFVASVEEAIATSRPATPVSVDATWQAGELQAPLQKYVRIESRRLDGLMDLVGELVTMRDRLLSLGTRHADPALDEAIGKTGRLIGELQDGVIGTRLVPVWQVFDRFPRVVREAARVVGKDATLSVEGREIELDRSLLEQVADPLVHLLRNAVDHGIESAEVRVRAGKSPEGRVLLMARRERNSVVIVVADDGGGVNRSKVLAKARRLGWVTDETDTLTDEEVLRIIARPGFSTADRVSEVSGRGVGIDAVLARVRGLGGAVEFSSVEGKGTVFQLRLPVTLAIIPAIIAQVGDESYALPLTHVNETIQPSAGARRTIQGRAVFVLRGQVLPLYSLRTLVGTAGRDGPGQQIVIVEATDRRAALLVDRLAGQQDIVVKSFDLVRGMSAGVSGAAILPDGTAALILDAGGLL